MGQGRLYLKLSGLTTIKGGESLNKSRLEAITDGIIAIAATIMVLELGVPSSNDLAGLMELRW